MSKKVIELFTPEGDVKEYKPFSARLPEFLKTYPKSEGYQVSVETTDTLSSKPSMFKLYEAAIAAGKNPTELGLPPLPAGDVVVFKASLLNKDGVVLESATALRVIREYKDWEKGETAARQRLIAALGFGGDCFDDDEISDIQDQGLSTGQSRPAQQAPSNSESEPAKAPAKAAAKPAAAQQVQQEPSARPNDESKTAAAVTRSDVDQAKPTQKATSKDEGNSEEIPARIIRQIQHQANLKSKEIPAYSTVKEAKQVLKDLMRS